MIPNNFVQVAFENLNAMMRTVFKSKCTIFKNKNRQNTHQPAIKDWIMIINIGIVGRESVVFGGIVENSQAKN